MNGSDVNEIVLHCLDIDVASATFVAAGGASSTATEITYQKEKFQTATFQFGAALPAGSGTLKLNFKGVLNDKVTFFCPTPLLVDFSIVEYQLKCFKTLAQESKFCN